MAERDMVKTLGVNTHKGTIYLFLLLCGAAGHFWQAKGVFTPTEICEFARDLARPQIDKELKAVRSGAEGLDTCLTTGLKAYRDFGLPGIRGEVLSGYRLSRTVGLPALKECLERGDSLDNALAHSLLVLMSVNDDTTLLNRSYRVENISLVQAGARKVLQAGGIFTEAGFEQLWELEEVMREKRLSPGGSADLLATGLFLLLISELQEGGDGFQRILSGGNTSVFGIPYPPGSSD